MIDYARSARDAKHAADASQGMPVLLVGGAQDRGLTLAALEKVSGSTAVCLNVVLTQALIEVSGSKFDFVSAMAAMEPSSTVLLLDRIQILMLPQLKAHVLDVLCRLARRRPVCASWPGHLDKGRLRYADPDHPEYLDDDSSRAIVIDLLSLEGTHR